MRALILDCSDFGFTLDHKTPAGEEIGEDDKKGSYNECLAVFITFEKQDREDILNRAASDIIEIAKNNKRNTVFINPFAHLSSSLAKPKEALKLLKALEIIISKEDFGIRAIFGAFGWYKKFEMKIEGHSNSQIYREY